MKIIRKMVLPLTITLIISFIIGTILIKNNLNKNKYNDIEIVKDTIAEKITEKEITTDKNIKYHIDIKGAVKNPGVYELDSHLTVNDAIKIAGGLTSEADTSIINLAKKISDEMVIIIYTKEEVKTAGISHPHHSRSDHFRTGSIQI